MHLICLYSPVYVLFDIYIYFISGNSFFRVLNLKIKMNRIENVCYQQELRNEKYYLK